jgi:hypothetical protein
MITVGYPFDRSLSAVDFVLHHIENVLIAFLGMGNDAAGTVLDSVLKLERTVAFQQIERAPAEQTGLPFIKVVAGVERAVLVGKKLVVHLCNSSLGNFLGGPG